jgi:uncharacterized membrane protein
MVALPAWVWRFGLVVRALIAGAALGVVTGLLALFGSNSLLAFVIAFVVITMVYGGLTARRMNKLWPGAKALSPPDRVAVVRAARAGADVGDSRLAPAVIEYGRALKAAADRRLWRWLIAVLGVVALVTAILDTLYSPVREWVVSWLYFAFFPIEAWWWPRRQSQLLANAERAEESARHLQAEQT